jgi:hypothetical protein
MSERIRKWRFWCHVFAPLMNRAPEFFPLLVRWYVRVDIPADCEVADLPPEPAMQRVWAWEPETVRQGEAATVRVLFDPNCDRPNCLGACRSIAAALPPDVTFAYLQSARHPVPLADDEPAVPCRERLVFGSPIRLLKLIYWMRARCREIDPRLSAVMWRHLPFLIKQLMVIQLRLATARRILVEQGVHWFVSPNEQGPLASVFVVACKLEGVRSAQFLHGIPCGLYTPFWSDEFWVWGDITKNMLDKAVPWSSDAIHTAGALEFLERTVAVPSPAVAPAGRQTKTLLFLAQDVVDRIWETTACGEATRVVAKAVAQKGNWSVRLRSHPQATDEDRRVLKSIFTDEGVEAVFSNDSLADDVAASDFVCTASSSAILEALLAGVPLRLVWNHGLDLIHGQPFLPEALVAYSVDELADALSDGADHAVYSQALASLAGQGDPLAWMVERITAEHSRP